MDILAHSGGSQDGGSKESDPRKDTEAPFNTATPVTTQTSASQSPSTSLEAGGARGTDPEISFTDLLLQRPVSLRTLTSLDGNAESFSFSWTMNNNSGNNVDINWIAWVARPTMISSEADQVIVDNIIINPKMSAVNRERNFLSDDSNGQKGVTINYRRWLDSLQNGKDTGQRPEGAALPAGKRLASDTDFMRLQISWTKRSTRESKISNTGVFFIKNPAGLESEPIRHDNVTGYEETAGTNGGVATSMTHISSLPTSTDAPDKNGGAKPTEDTNSKGLPTGAIAGIVIGSAIAVVLVAGLTWFFLRRRRNRNEPSFDPQYKTAPFMENKALSATQVVDSHRSGLSEDSGPQDYTTHNTNTSPVGIAYGGQDQPSHDYTGSFTNLHDTGISNGPLNYPGHSPDPTAIAAIRGVREHQHGADTDSGREDPTYPHITLPIPSRIRHLVEPHHTDNDVRRLLAEEDHLDEEIARGS
ncbi:hypothetical protein X797_004096 [Metarhizium robertsii]|uniref:Uncharacterized protein n=2 Tax=Metarhizium robertsii TaxID=568076 RepID=E9EW65_METRA|nr:uncharacterized protein MAA_04264 [Metarhizium robertsii ARSEF 23]EFZ00487.1 hypothetical protein MAA_04264 [Metarhizium robertsii ARSEF 23]EXV02973.1 hypothetical protein X797_004096 [Metarhizium robertsii]